MNKIFILIFLILINNILGFSQDLMPPEPSGDQVAKIKKMADKHFTDGDYNIAANKYAQIIKSSANDPEICYKYATSILHANYNKEAAIPYFETAIKAGNLQAIKMLGLTYHEMYKFDEALNQYNLYISKSDTNSRDFKSSDIRHLIKCTYDAAELTHNPVDVTIENVGPMINSPFADYVPIVTADDQEIFFTSRRASSTGGNLDHNDEYFEDIFYALKDSATGTWQHSRHLSENLNSHTHDAVAGLSADGQTLLIYRNDLYKHGGDLYISYLRDTTWSEPKILNNEISMAGTWEPSATLTANEDALYFTSDREGGYGGRDLYMAKRLPNGTWGIPENLGAGINTPFDEDAPFIHPDSKTLYFSSRGHKNMGGFDVFKSEKLINGNWGDPVNMGYPINTTDDDIYFTVNAAGTHGYYTSLGEDSYGEKDIYLIKFKPREKKLAILKGKVTDMQNKPLASQIYISKTNTRKLNGLYNSNAQSGKYLVVIQPGFSYNAVFKADGYYNDTIIVNAEEIDSFNEVIKNIKLRKLSDSLPDTTRIIHKEILVIGRKPLLAVTVPSALVTDNHPRQILIDTNGKQEVIAVLPADSVGKKSPLRISLSNDPSKTINKFTKDCEIDFSDSVHILTFNFGYKMYDFNKRQYAAMDSILKPIRRKIIGIKINAHTDNIGSLKYNIALSQKRAKSISKHLKTSGFPSKKIIACFYGESKPLFENIFENGEDNPGGRYKNRRAEIQFFIKE